MPLSPKVYCQRRVNGKRCTKEAMGYCKEHVRDKCNECLKRTATFECRTCHKPLCSTCQCHNSFGH